MILERTIVQQALNDTGWKIKNTNIFKTYIFNSFRDAIVFVHEVADISEEKQHQPDIEIKYTRVKITLSTHDEGGVTEKDVELAYAFDSLY